MVLNSYFETGFPLPTRLAEEFTKQFPNVTFDIKEDQFANMMENSPRILSEDNAPDLIRLPSMTDLVANELLKNLDGYFTEFGWDKFPAGQLVQLRVEEGGRPRGTGSLYAMGLNYSMTGVFYNKELAAQIGMTEPPKTAGRARCPDGQGQGSRHSADHAVEQGHRRPRLPAAEPDGRLWRSRADQ